MKYFKARKVDYKPYLIFDLVAYSFEELEQRDLIKNGVMEPGVISESYLPVNQFGICIMDLDDHGNLISRSETDLEKGRIEETKEQLKNEIERLKSYLKETDWIILKCIECRMSVKEKYPEYYLQRQIARQKINELEKTLNL